MLMLNNSISMLMLNNSTYFLIHRLLFCHITANYTKSCGLGLFL